MHITILIPLRHNQHLYLGFILYILHTAQSFNKILYVSTRFHNMGNPRALFYPLFIILFSCSAWSTEDLMSCLTRNGISNYTTSSSPDYETLLKLPIQNLRFTKPALSRAPLLIFPNDPHQMSLSFTCSRSSSATIRLRSGGHAYEGFSSLVSDETPFVIIDMMNLNRVEVDVGEGTAWLQGGPRWERFTMQFGGRAMCSPSQRVFAQP